jgi:surface carbohydrate biosynthesis protein (TIGR04326 family)
MGIPHATVCFWDLRYFFDIRSYKQNKNNSLPLPDKVGVNGSASKKMYISGGYPCQDIIEVEALRFLYLDRVKKSRVIINNRLLVLTDYLEENVKLQMNLLKKALLQCREKIELIVKPHPFCPISIDDFPEMDIKIINNKTIYQAMKCCNVVFTSNITSAAVDSFCSGKVVISMLNPKTVNMSPLKDNGIIFVSTPDELVNYLNNLNNLNNSTNQKSDFFFTNPNLDKWNNILKNYCN